MGWRELEGVHNRTDYDLGRHTQYSGKDLQYIDQDNNNGGTPVPRYIPYIIETSAGLRACSNCGFVRSIDRNNPDFRAHWEPAW
jgi:glycyl-tRNA synthetase (class II)